MLAKTYGGVKTAQIIDKFRPVVKATLNNFIGEMMNERITTALKKNSAEETEAQNTSDKSDEKIDVADLETKSQVVTTEEELQAYYIVKAALAAKVDVSKITHKDTVNYFAVTYNGMVTKWICRLFLTAKKKVIEIPNADGVSVKHELKTLEDIYKHAEALIESACRFFDKQNKESQVKEVVTV